MIISKNTNTQKTSFETTLLKFSNAYNYVASLLLMQTVKKSWPCILMLGLSSVNRKWIEIYKYM